MKPDARKRPVRVARGDEARVRLLLRTELDWARGYPVAASVAGIEVEVVPLGEDRPPYRVTVDRAALSRATRTVNMLFRDFRNALPRVVGRDVEGWRESLKALISAYKPTLHHGAGLVRLAIERFPKAARTFFDTLQGDHAALRSFADRQTWLRWMEPDELAHDLEIVSEHREAFLRVVTLPEAVPSDGHLLLHLLREDGERARPLLERLADPRCHTLLFDAQAHATLVTRASKDQRFVDPIPRQGRTATKTLFTILRSVAAVPDQKARRRGLATFQALDLDRYLEAWREMWEAFDAAEREIARGRAADPAVRSARAQALGKAARAIRAPLSVDLEACARLVTVASCAKAPSWIAALARAMTRLEDTTPGFTHRLACHWLELSQLHDHGKHVVATIRHAIEHLARPEASTLAAWLAPYDDLLRHAHHHHAWRAPDSLLAEDPRTKPALVFEALARFATDHAKYLDVSGRTLLVALSRFPELSARDLCERVIAAQTRNINCTFFNASPVQVAHRIAATDPEQFAEVLARTVRVTERTDFRTLTIVTRTLADADDRLLTHLMTSGRHFAELIEVANLAQLTGRARLSARLRAASGEATAPPAFAAHYPPAFRDALSDLAASDPNAEKTARGILRDDFPDPAALERELEALRARTPSSPSTARRIENLSQRLVAPRAVSSSRIAKLVAKVERASVHAAFDAWLASNRSAILERSERRLGLASERFGEHGPRIVAAIGALPPPFRDLGLRILRARAGSPPWDLWDDPRNRAFVEGLVKAGIDPVPWIEGIGARRIEVKGHAPVVLELERDPLEVLMMGEHFSTCLSLGAVNFFSAVVNAADVNKRMIAIRSEQGSLLGRCLLALTEQGHLVAFETYAHREWHALATAVEEFGEELASRMKTVVTNRGVVPPLLAPDWYDDGIRSWRDGPDDARVRGLREQLAHLSATNLVVTAEAALAPLALNELTITMMLGWPELREHPKLACVLIERLVPFDDRRDETVMDALRIAWRAEDRSLTQRLARGRLAEFLMRAMRRPHPPFDLLEILIALDPVSALHVLRRTKPREARRHRTRDLERTWQEARALEALGRRAAAARRYLEIVTLGYGGYTEEARRALERLGRPLDG